ncbi:MAG: CoA ester lyase [Lautropia sp.]
MTRYRSWLFVPGSRPDRFDKALSAGADQVIVDLEDAVGPADKVTARDALARWLDTPGPSIVVRINGADTEWFADDLALLRRPRVAQAILPKAESAEQIAATRAAFGAARASDAAVHAPVVALIESALGIARLASLCGAPGLSRLAFGTIDFQADLGMRGATEDDLAPWRTEILLRTRLAGIAAPLDGVSTAIDDATALATDIARARRLGFGGKLCIHPRQVAATNAGFASTPDEIAWARRVIDAAEAAGGGAVAVDGKMVDRPVLLRAHAVLAEAP